MTLLKLPPEIHVLITEHFDWCSFLHYRHTCKYFRDITETLSLEQVWYQVWPIKPYFFNIVKTLYSGFYMRAYKDIYALCLTIFTTICCRGIVLPNDISAFRRRYNYVGKAKMFQVYKELQATRGLSLINLGEQICRQHIELERGLIIDLEVMCLDILDYIKINAGDIDVSEIEQCVAMCRHIVKRLFWMSK